MRRLVGVVVTSLRGRVSDRGAPHPPVRRLDASGGQVGVAYALPDGPSPGAPATIQVTLIKP